MTDFETMLTRYLFEGEEMHVLKREWGFCTYAFDFVSGAIENHVYIQDLYVDPKYRKSGVASDMADDVVRIARERGVHALYGSVSLHRRGAETAMKILAAYGMRLFAAQSNVLWFKKDI